MNSLFQIVLCFIFAIALFGWGNSNNAQIRWMRDNGIPATGKVTAVYPVFRIYINYAVEYKTADGNTELSSLSFADVVRLGDKVELLYNPGDDRSVMLA